MEFADHVKVSVLPVLPTHVLAEDAHAEVRAVIETGLSQLKEWLDGRLRLQEDLLRCMAKSHEQDVHAIAARESVARKGLTQSSSGQAFCIDASVSQDEEVSSSLRQVAACKVDVCPPGCLPEDGDAMLEPEMTHLASEGPAEIETLAVSCGPEAWPAALEATINTKDSMGSSHLMFLEEWHQQDWQSKLMDCFDQLDLDRSGSIDRHEILEAFDEVGLPPGKAFRVFQRMDKTNNGVVDRVEWLRVIEEAARDSKDVEDELVEFVERLAIRQRDKGQIYESPKKGGASCVIRHDSAFRMMWDVLMMLLLIYIAVMLPYSFGFGQSDTLDTVERIFDLLFCCDVVLNFRTTYADSDESVIVDWRRIACKYLKTWFLLDFFSSVPLDLVTAGIMPNLTPARLLKIGKIAKVLKLLRFGKMLKVCKASELSDKVEEQSMTKAHQTLARVGRLAVISFLLTHWLACFGVAIDTRSYDAYFDGENPTEQQKYLAALYWAMTTLSTVGYGDITPTSDEERAYAMFAMVVGGAFYGYIIGSITSVVADMDLNARAYYERMDLIQSWLDKHDEIPKAMRRNIRKYFKMALSRKAAVDDSWVFADLTPELRADTAVYIIHERLRLNPMFIDVSNTALANLVEVVQKHHLSSGECVVKDGDPGVAMYVLVHGIGRYDKGTKWRPHGVIDTDSSGTKRFQQLIPGDSFGEEIIFGLDETYSYTIVTITDSIFHSISEDGFKDRYRNMPELRRQMFNKYIKSCGGDPRVVHEQYGLDDDLVAQNDEHARDFKGGKAVNKLNQRALGKSKNAANMQNPYRRKVM